MIYIFKQFSFKSKYCKYLNLNESAFPKNKQLLARR